MGPGIFFNKSEWNHRKCTKFLKDKFITFENFKDQKLYLVYSICFNNYVFYSSFPENIYFQKIDLIFMFLYVSYSLSLQCITFLLEVPIRKSYLNQTSLLCFSCLNNNRIEKGPEIQLLIKVTWVWHGGTHL